MKVEFGRTEKQQEIMSLILDASERGVALTLASLRVMLSYGPDVSKQAVLCSLRILMEHGFLEKVYHGKKLIIIPTAAAYREFRSMKSGKAVL